MLVLYLLIAFLIGGIPFGLILGHLFGRGDIRRSGSGNIGATNVLRVVGPMAAVLALIGDIGKGAAAVWLGGQWTFSDISLSGETIVIAGGIVAILGHVFSPYLRFRGGKGVNTALGVFLVLAPIESLAALAVFIISVSATRYVSLGSILASLTFAGMIWIEKLIFNHDKSWLLAGIAAFLAIFIIFTHRSNIGRLLTGTENRLQLRKSAS